MYGCESWTVKKAECRRIDAFELWCWRRLLRVPWTARRSNQSILKEISPGISMEGMMLKLKLQCFGHLMQRVDSLEKTLMLGGIGGRRRRGRQRMRWHHWLDGRESEWTPGVGDGQGGLEYCSSWGRKESDTTEWLNWTESFQFLHPVWMRSLLGRVILIVVFCFFFFHHFQYILPLPLACSVSAERSAVNLTGIPLYVICCFSLAAFNTFSLCLIFVSLINMCLGVFLFGLLLHGTLWASWIGVVISFPTLGKF